MDVAVRIVEDFGREALNKISRSAINIATGIQTAETITISGAITSDRMNGADIEAEFARLSAQKLAVLNDTFDKLVEGYHLRADRAHGNFLERATSSLIAHLEKLGDDKVWEYDPTGLRMLLRSAYTVFGARAQMATTKLYKTTAKDIAILYGMAFGQAVEGISIEAPAAPYIKPPVCLGQTIAMDFRDSWWKSWWRRRRGYQAFAQDFQEAIKAETSGLLSELKVDQADAVRAAALQGLTEFLDEQRTIISGLSEQGNVDRASARELFSNGANMERKKALENTVETLTRCAA